MVSLSQKEVALYLYDYCSLMYLMLENPDEKPFSLFKKYLIDTNRKIDNLDDYYKRIFRIVYIFMKMKSFSIAEDYTMKQKNNFVNNDDLDLSFLDSKITGNRNDLSNKKLLQKLRDGFNHSTEGNELYKISRNGKYIEFSFKEPSPIQIKIPIDDIASLTTAIGDVAQTLQHFSFDQPACSTIKEYIENLKITRHYFLKKVEMSKINDIVQYEAEEKYNEIDSVIKTINNVTEKDITLTEEQVESILTNIEGLINSNIMTLDEFRENLKDVIVVLLNKELPLPILKLDNYLLDSYFVRLLLPLKEFSYNQMLLIFLKGLKGTDPNPVNEYKDTFNVHRQMVFKSYFTSFDEKLAYTYLLFIEYIISNFKPEKEEITIDDQVIEYNKLRNSLVHGRWHLEKDKIVFYDALPNVCNEMDYNWSKKIDLYELYKYCAQVLESKLDLGKSKKLTKTVLSSDKVNF